MINVEISVDRKMMLM